MKNIKYKLIIYALISIFAWNATSCVDEVTSDTDIDEETVLKRLIYLEPLVLGAYSDFRESKKGRDGMMLNVGIDEAQQGQVQVNGGGTQGGIDKYNGLLDPANSEVKTLWDKRWPGIHSAMLAIYGLERNEENHDKVKKLLGEASFIRGLMTMEMTMIWGEVPIKDYERQAEIGRTRRPLKEVWEFVINDFKTATEKLPETNTPGRPTKYAAWAMLGKAYMSAPVETGLRDFDLAMKAFDNVTGKYQLLANFEDLYDYNHANSAESIFEIQFNPIWPDCNHWQWESGSRGAANSFTQGCYFGGWDFIMPTEYTFKTKAEGGIWEDGDLRKEASLRFDFTYHGQQPNWDDISWTGLVDEKNPHVKKFEDPRTDTYDLTWGLANLWNSGKNHTFLRYADVRLLYAECLNELGQTSAAIDIVNNEIRTRAWGGTLPADKKWGAMSQQQFRDEIMDERIRELCFEGWRRQDLIRTGTFVKLVKERNKWARETNMIQEFHTRFPIPDTEIRLNEDMTDDDQNPGYKQ